MLWWKSRPSTVHFELELFKPLGSIPADRFALQADEVIAVQLNAEDLMLNERFSFARISLSWVSFVALSNALFCSPGTSSTSGQNMSRRKDVLNKKHPV